MASPPETNGPTPLERKVQEDLWIHRSGGFGKNARWFAFSTAAHILILSLFATTAVTIAVNEQDLIKVKALPLSHEELEALAEDELPDDWEGEPSLEDIPGILTMEDLAPNRARPTGPASTGPMQAPIQRASVPIFSGIGPVTIEVQRTDTVFSGIDTQLSGLVGAGDLGGGGGFGDYGRGLRKVGLDVALVIDATDSMQFVIDSVRDRLSRLVTLLRKLVPTSRIGIVAYRDKGEEYVTKWVDLSFSTPKLKGFLANMQADGGGDWPEAVYEGLDAAVHDLSWRKRSRRVVIIAAGSPPHPESMGRVLGLAQGFQSRGGVVSVMDLADKMHEDFEYALWERTGKIMKVAFEPTPLPGFYRDFRNTMASVAQAGGGDFIPLTEERALTKNIIVMTFGSRWEVEMAKYLRDLE